MLHHLPLGWARAGVAEPRLHTVQLPLSQQTWIPTAEIPFDIPFEQIYRDYLQALPNGFVLQFCNGALSRYVTKNGGEAVQIGQEAVLPLQQKPWDRPSLQALVRRGLRWGKVEEVAVDPANRDRLSQLVAATRYAHRPQLSLAFRTGFDNTTRGFAFVAPNGQWQAAVTLSQVTANYLHTELLLRHRQAAVGVVEALLVTVAETLQHHGLQAWSLGGVPFARTESPVTPAAHTLKSTAVNYLGQILQFAYNYRGLYRFKDKFSPCWRPLFLCGAPSFPWRVLLDLAIKMQYLHLVAYSAWDVLLSTAF